MEPLALVGIPAFLAAIGIAWLMYLTPLEHPDRTWADHHRGWPPASRSARLSRWILAGVLLAALMWGVFAVLSLVWVNHT